MKKPYWYSRSRSSSSMPAATAEQAPAAGPQPRERTRPGAAADANPGCMAMVHCLVFAPGSGCVGTPPSQAASYHDTSSSSHIQGLEAPRNSLELDGDQLEDIQIGVQIEPAFDALARRSAKLTAPSSEAETPRTPSLVARLMGIHGLPEQSSPSPALKKAAKPRASSSSTDRAKINKEDPSSAVKEKKRVIPESMNKEPRQPLRSLSCNVPTGPGEARSLPDTPRASWDVVDHPRLSLQALKENVLDRATQYMSLPTSPTSCCANKKKNHRTAGRREAAKEHAREIVRQAKKSASSKENAASPLVLDLEDKLVVVQAPAAAGKPTAPPQKAQADQQAQAPRLPLAPKAPPRPRAKPSRPPPLSPLLDPPPRAVPPPAVNCRKPDGCERFAFSTRIKKPATSQQAPPPVAAPVDSRSTDRDSSSVDRRNDLVALTSRSTALPLEEDPEYSYVRTVIERGGFMRTTTSWPWKGHSVAAPVDPIIFHLLEVELPADEAWLGPLRHRWNRKLLFHLVQEILADLLLGLDAAAPPGSGPALVGRLWRRVQSFPAADCKVVGDIDALVATDLEVASVRRLVRHPAVEEEAGDVSDEVADQVLDALLGEYCAEESLPLSRSSSGCGCG